MFAVYSRLVIFIRRLFALFFVLFTWPCALIPKLRARYGSFLHRYWVKEGDKPVWLMNLEKGNGKTPESFDLG